MKRYLIMSSLFLFLLAGNITAQEKVKEKDDKTKMKDKNANIKVKDKEEKFKAKDDENKVKMKSDETKQPVDGMTALPYTANYSSNFVIGNPEHSKMILDLWKDWDDNAFDRHDYFADTMVMILSDGQVLHGKAAIVEGAKKVRGGFTSATSALDAWVPLKSVDKNEDWVALWGHEDDVLTDGSKQKRELHEIWRINKDGKIDYMQQWTAVPAQPPGN